MELEIRCQHCSREEPLLGYTLPTSYTLIWWKENKLVFWPNPIYEEFPLPSWPNYLIKAIPPNTINQGLDFNIRFLR
jgi:hypothetical protein